MNIGDIVMAIPTCDCSYGEDKHQAGKPRKATVVYVHPAGRFYTVEFKSKYGCRWRESYLLLERGEKEGAKAAEKTARAHGWHMDRYDRLYGKAASRTSRT